MDLVNHISSEINLLTNEAENCKFLLAVSGGMDSMVLMHCFKKLNLNFEVAHFNYQLRGEESDGDEKLVRDNCKNQNTTFHFNTTDTNSWCEERGLSIQEGARELRYNWFLELMEKEKFDFIITAHHANDTIETFFINLLRGAGIKGLSGIPQKNNQIIRPLLKVKRTDIENFAQLKNIEYRDDSSNSSLKYKRNFIRHKIIPELLTLDSNADNSILQSMDLLHQTNEYLEKKIEEDLGKITTIHGDQIIIKIEEELSQIVLYHALKKQGFNSSQVNNIFQNRKVGSKFYSKSHQLVIDRNQLIINKITSDTAQEFFIKETGTYTTPFKINISKEAIPLSLETSQNIALLDADKLEFPLTIRKWQEGDWFIPLGMEGKKKLSDYFIDNKFSRFEKEQIWVLVCKDEIAWIIGNRIDNRFKITKQSKNVIRFVTE